MNPTHKVIIDPKVLDNWFTKINRAHRNPNGAFYEMKMNQIKKARLIGVLRALPPKAVDAVFLVSTLSDLQTNDLYMTILDRKYMDQIDEVRWKGRDRDNYWHTGSYKTPLDKLHQMVYYIAHGQPAADNVHHKNFFTFDNRADNLEDVTDSQHGQRHANVPAIINIPFRINNDTDILDVFNSVL